MFFKSKIYSCFFRQFCSPAENFLSNATIQPLHSCRVQDFLICKVQICCCSWLYMWLSKLPSSRSGRGDQSPQSRWFLKQYNNYSGIFQKSMVPITHKNKMLTPHARTESYGCCPLLTPQKTNTNKQNKQVKGSQLNWMLLAHRP